MSVFFTFNRLKIDCLTIVSSYFEIRYVFHEIWKGGQIDPPEETAIKKASRISVKKPFLKSKKQLFSRRYIGNVFLFKNCRTFFIDKQLLQTGVFSFVLNSGKAHKEVFVTECFFFQLLLKNIFYFKPKISSAHKMVKQTLMDTMDTRRYSFKYFISQPTKDWSK